MLKCIAIMQPWATLIVHGFKQYETRSWITTHRGPLLVQASRRFDNACSNRATKLQNTAPDTWLRRVLRWQAVAALAGRGGAGSGFLKMRVPLPAPPAREARHVRHHLARRKCARCDCDASVSLAAKARCAD